MSKYLKGFLNKVQNPKGNEDGPTPTQTPQDSKANRDPLDRVQNNN